MVEPQERRIAVSGLTFRVREWPGDGPPVVLAHGLASNSRIWDEVAPDWPTGSTWWRSTSAATA